MDPITVTVAGEPVEPVESTLGEAQQKADEEGLSFAGTPGPGDSEGGDVYEPEVAPKKPL